MNLRSVFTAEQQRILERYYENGMTNQSKACFQLILQCAQEAKLDFSVVRTWVGNKRRKLASKVEQNGSASHPLSSHGIAGGLLSGPALAGSVSGSNNNNNDVILTGIYSLNPVTRSRPRPQAPQSQSDSEISIRTSSSLINQALQSRSTSTSSPIHSKLLTPSPTLPPLTSASGSLVYTAIRKGTLSVEDGGISAGAGLVPHSWTRQYGTMQTRPWSSSSQSQSQLQPRPHSNPQPQPPAPQKPRASLPAQNAGPSSEQTPRIQQVFTLSEKGDREHPRSGQASAPRSQETYRPTPHPLDAGHNFSIAMETGNEEDEWLREEELANMAAQTHIHREQPTGGEASVAKGNCTPPATGSRPAAHPGNATLQGSYSLTVQTSLPGEPSSKVRTDLSKLHQNPFTGPIPVCLSPPQLQDRTQFSDGDLVQLKRYWDRGMTSLGSVCREKIAAAANQLNVDTEIVKTWISNRRRKYRLMGIEIPPPKGGPAVFTNPSPGSQSPAAASPDEVHLRTPELPDDLTDGGSVCMSEGGACWFICTHELVGFIFKFFFKIEVIDEDEEADEDGDLMVSDLEQMQNLLEFKHEEVQFLENELENQKQKYQELANFTESLLSAVRDNDLERQKLASLPYSGPQPLDPGHPGSEAEQAARTSTERGRHAAWRGGLGRLRCLRLGERNPGTRWR
uniref:Highly divergent homeobox n=1 Tax=Xiphophorus couchianus TaxID=32473 RepID=A0A3B5M675_9TELE